MKKHFVRNTSFCLCAALFFSLTPQLMTTAAKNRQIKTIPQTEEVPEESDSPEMSSVPEEKPAQPPSGSGILPSESQNPEAPSQTSEPLPSVPDASSEENTQTPPPTSPSSTQKPVSGTDKLPDTSSSEITAMQGTFYAVSKGGLNVRSGPSSSYDKIGMLPYGTEISVTGKTQDGWVRIIYSGSDGYVSAQYLSETLPDNPVAPDIEAPETSSADIPRTDIYSAEGIDMTGSLETDETLSTTAMEYGTSMVGTPVLMLLLLAIVIVAILIGCSVYSLLRRENDENYEEEEEEEYYEEDTEAEESGCETSDNPTSDNAKKDKER